MSEQASPFHRFNLRRQSAEHPMAMFAIVVLATLALMALMPPPGLAFPSIAPIGAALAAQSDATARTLADSSPELACSGQSWGAESGACLVAIAREAGRSDRLAIRRIALGQV